MSDSATDGVTQKLVAFVKDLDATTLPPHVQHECTRALLDAVGCMVGGAHHELVEVAHEALVEFSGPAQASPLGRARKVDVLTAALLNGLAGAAYSFFETYSDALLHPAVPVAGALLALSERHPVTGRQFLSAFAAGLEVACRLTKGTALPPAEANEGWSQTGIVCGVAAALASGKMLGLDQQQLGWALGTAASEASGTRAEHGSMAASLVIGRTAQTGLRAALLAANGFSSSAGTIESRFGFANTFAQRPNLPAMVENLGAEYEIAQLTYKPFPCGIVIHAAIDAMLQLKAEAGFESSAIASISAKVSKGAATFGMRANPANEIEAKFSLHHWVAAAAMLGRAGIPEGRLTVVRDPEIVRLRSIMTAEPDLALAQEAADMTITFKDGRTQHKRIEHCLGSAEAPMTDADLERKFVEQVGMVIGSDRATDLAASCRNIMELTDVSILPQKAAEIQIKA